MAARKSPRKTDAERIRARELKSCRNRKCSCEVCGYTVLVSRSWMAEGLPICPKHGAMMPALLHDRAFIGLVGPDDMSGPDWTRVCYLNGWDDAIARKGAAANVYADRVRAFGGILGRPIGAAHCVHPGCGLWIAAGATHCHAGHAQDAGAADLEPEPMPF